MSNQPCTVDSCQDAPALSVKIDTLAERHNELVVFIKESLVEIKGMMKEFTADLKQSVKEDKEDIAKLEVLNHEQQTRLALLEEKQKGIMLETQEQGKIIDTHGKRLAQGGAMVLVASLLLPVAFEAWLGQPQAPQSENRV